MTADRNAIVVGVDDSSASRCALEWAVVEATARRAPLDVVYAWRNIYRTWPGGPSLVDLAVTSRAEAEGWLAALVARTCAADQVLPAERCSKAGPAPRY